MAHADDRLSSPSGPGNPPRFGPCAIIREAPPSGDAHQLSLFVAADEPGPTERRRSPRIQAVERRAWLGWWATPGEFTTHAARLDDISQGGAKLVTADPPPADQVVWLCLGAPDPTECVQAKVLQVSPTPDGTSIVRLAFGIPCPQNLYQVAISGLTSRNVREG